jgi:hypothetical protein
MTAPVVTTFGATAVHRAANEVGMFWKRQLKRPLSADKGMSLAMLGSSTLVGPGLGEPTIDAEGGWVVTGGDVVVVVVGFGRVVVVGFGFGFVVVVVGRDVVVVVVVEVVEVVEALTPAGTTTSLVRWAPGTNRRGR